METCYVLETRQLSHRFAGGETILSDINLKVPAGSIYGFLGPNGAGKTTTLRLVLGLLLKQQGQIQLFGQDFEHHRLQALQKIGALIESPSLYGHLTAIENLQLLQHIYQCPQKRIGQVLEMVGLAGTGGKRVARFSLGMKQRLSIAMALLHQPSLLVLDEPTNGLDPNGVIDIRQLLLDLNRQQGITILISSHLLAEIEKLVSHVGIIHRGRLLFQGTLAELQQEHASGRQLILKTSNDARTAAILHAQGIDSEFSASTFRLPLLAPAAVAILVRELVRAGIGLYEITPTQNDLEGIFINMVTTKNPSA